ncbi:DUF6233 domain-containing protein [Streptomyces sp. A1136]|uniref:DUF6233 domain-containing protein n=1 Tax=Streptomyces sp. A1136 TaxID=2563102 RepID=UPI00109E9628|nr:DUF6233 domain-containing protein [Streptomyces sp. A1136]THA47107.1 hypothetical protein E6R62_32130 [Streptomyces sp. A1136]
MNRSRWSRPSGLEAALTEEESRLPPLPPPDWKVDAIRTATGRRALLVHVGICGMGKGKPINRDQARRMLADGVDPCPYCSPDASLGMPG